MTTTQGKSKNRGKSNEYGLVDHLRLVHGLTAKRVPLSGAMASMPGDVTVEELSLLIEAKVYAWQEVSGEKSMRLNLTWFDKIRAEATRIGYQWCAVVVRGKALHHRYVLISLDEYIKLIKCQNSR